MVMQWRSQEPRQYADRKGGAPGSQRVRAETGESASLPWAAGRPVLSPFHWARAGRPCLHGHSDGATVNLKVARTFAVCRTSSRHLVLDRPGARPVPC